MQIDLVKGQRESATVESSLLDWVAVHGCMCLGLRHSDSFGPGRELMLQFLERLDVLLVERGMLTQADLDSPKGRRESATVDASLLDWVAVHGCMCLGLRQPDSCGPSRELMLQFLERLGVLLVERGMMTRAELDSAMQVEREVRMANLQ
jgi:hypothetical protein